MSTVLNVQVLNVQMLNVQRLNVPEPVVCIPPKFGLMLSMPNIVVEIQNTQITNFTDEFRHKLTFDPPGPTCSIIGSIIVVINSIC